MTAEVVIMNKEAVALAADSAVTITRGRKIFTSANKLFALSKYHPVGIMVYGNALLLNVPWETIVKVYRSELGLKKLGTLRDYASDFLTFLDGVNPLFTDSAQDRYVQDSILSYFGSIREAITRKIHSCMDENGQITVKAVRQIVTDIVAENYRSWATAENIPSIPTEYNKQIMVKYDKFVEAAIRNTFEKLPLTRRGVTHLKEIAGSLFSRFPTGIPNQNASGIIIAGFGNQDVFPSRWTCDIEGVANNKLKYREQAFVQIGLQTGAALGAFAQREMVSTFMEGIDPDLSAHVNEYLSRLFKEYPGIIVDNIEGATEQEKKGLKRRLKKASTDLFKDFQKEMDNYRKEKYVDPVLGVVDILPKDELAAMAESLVNLTSFKRRVTMERETVGGPIDVAVISKGDGFVWIKRKHYFKPELNPQFFANYYREQNK